MLSGPEHSNPKPVNEHDTSWTNARSLDSPEARQCSEWILLVGDLEYALRRAQLWKDIINTSPKNDRDLEICVSLFRDAVISLVACFDNTLPVFLDPSSVYNRIAGGLEYFEWLKGLRHTWVAHRSGPERQCRVAILLDEQTGDFHGFGHLCHSYRGPKADAGNDFVRMMKIALDHARRELEKHESIVRKKIEEMGYHERLRLPFAETIIPSSKEINMGRRKFQNIKRSSKRKNRS